MANGKSKYIPNKNPKKLPPQKRLDELKKQVDQHGKNIDAISKSHDNHITMLSNFARHDIKNSIQSMDSILNSNTMDELTESHLESMKLNLKIIRETIDNFSKLVPYSEKDTFEFQDLLIAIELINRENFYVNKIQFIKPVLQGTFTFNLPFQSVLQMINNIILNAIKAFDRESTDKRIKIEINFDKETFMMKIYDNAGEIAFEKKDSIFEYGVSSSGGSGIGLYHARYLCNLYKGHIEVFEAQNDEYTKYFLITLPIINNK